MTGGTGLSMDTKIVRAEGCEDSYYQPARCSSPQYIFLDKMGKRRLARIETFMVHGIIDD